MNKIGKHNVIQVRFDSNEAGTVVCLDCENDIVMEIPLPSNCIKLVPDHDKEYIHIKADGIFTAHVHSNTYQKIAEFFVETQKFS